MRSKGRPVRSVTESRRSPTRISRVSDAALLAFMVLLRIETDVCGSAQRGRWAEPDGLLREEAVPAVDELLDLVIGHSVVAADDHLVLTDRLDQVLVGVQALRGLHRVPVGGQSTLGDRV